MSLAELVVEQAEEIIDYPVFAYDPENVRQQDPFMEDLNKKLEVIIKSDYVADEPKKKSIYEQLMNHMEERESPDGNRDSSAVFSNLVDIISDALGDWRIMHSPNFTGHSQDDRAIKVRIRHFLRGRRGLTPGVELYAIRIEQCLYALVKYAGYSNNYFGYNNRNLRTALQRYDILKERMDKTKDPLKKATYLHSMIIAVEILFGKQIQLVAQEEITPTVSNDMGSSDEFSTDGMDW